MIVVGVISGTSADGVDVAVADLHTDGDLLVLDPIGARTLEWPGRLRTRVLATLPPAATTVAEVCRLDTELGQAIGASVTNLCRTLGVTPELIASHGQTVFHWVEDGQARGTLQLGQPAWIVEATGVPVVSDLRARDIAAGGHGAPLASTLDALWLAGSTPRAALNLGGIANVTVVGETVTAFDTGPANCLLDVAVTRATGLRFDADGALAAGGSVRPDLLAALLEEPYYARPAPKSTGRELFDTDYVAHRLAGLPEATTADLLTTLTELSAVTIADALRPYGVGEVVASGGGVRNRTLMDALRRTLSPAQLRTSAELGLPADAKEAYLMALLGWLSWHQLPGVVPGGTGSAVPRVLGRLSFGDRPVRLPEPIAVPRRLVVKEPA